MAKKPKKDQLTVEEVEERIQRGEMQRTDYPIKLYFANHDNDVFNEEVVNYLADYLRLYTIGEFCERFDEYVKYALQQRFSYFNSPEGERLLEERYELIQSELMVTIRLGGGHQEP